MIKKIDMNTQLDEGKVKMEAALGLLRDMKVRFAPLGTPILNTLVWQDGWMLITFTHTPPT